MANGPITSATTFTGRLPRASTSLTSRIAIYSSSSSSPGPSTSGGMDHQHLPSVDRLRSYRSSGWTVTSSWASSTACDGGTPGQNTSDLQPHLPCHLGVDVVAGRCAVAAAADVVRREGAVEALERPQLRRTVGRARLL